ncbi:MAG TPA: hypothetical protein VMV94_11355 [Phycisphaerae bacterium]|nr:hypothetical protein [Phycisphaerae bacterium]
MAAGLAVAAIILYAADVIAQPPAPAVPSAPPASAPVVTEGQAAEGQPSSVTSRPAKLMQDRRVKRWMKAFAWSTVLLLIFAFGAIALVVFSRRFKDYLIRPARKPTEYVDVWQMHKLPPDMDGSKAGDQEGDDDH